MKNDDDEEEKVKEEGKEKDEKDDVPILPKKEEVEESMDTEMKSDVSSPLVNGTASPQPPSSVSSTSSVASPSPAQVTVGVKRPSEDEDSKPDLKKVRVVSSLNKHGFKVNGISFLYDLFWPFLSYVDFLS